jgi:putative peptidoglycan lipid II flippase
MSLARNTLVQAVFTMLSRLLGYARDRAISNMIGAGWIGDAFITAQMFPNLFRRILAEGAFSQAFVPLYAKVRQTRTHEEAEIMASDAFSVLTLVSAILTIVMQVTMPWIIFVIHNGQAHHKEAYDLAVLLTQITMPYLIGMAISSLFAGILNTASKFALSAAAPTLLNICILIAVLFTHDPKQAALNAAVAISIAGILQAAMLYYGCKRLGVSIGFRVPRLTNDVKTILKVMGPAVIAGSATQINVIVSQALSSSEVGAKSWLNAADRLYQLPLGLIGVAIGVALLPRIASAIANKDNKDDDIKAINEGLVLSMSLTLPAAAALLVIPYFLMFGFWAGGKFTAQDCMNTANALFHYAWGVPAFVLIRIFAPPFFARQDSKSPMMFAIAGVIANVVVGASLFYWMHKTNQTGYIGLAIGTSVAAWVNTFLLIFFLHKRGWWRMEKWVVDKLVKVLLASVVMVGYLFIARYFQDDIIGWFKFLKIGGKELAVLLVSLIGFAIYLGSAIAFKALTVADLKSAVRK